MKIAYIGEHHPTAGTYYTQRITVSQKEFDYINSKLQEWYNRTELDTRANRRITNAQMTILCYGKSLTETNHVGNKYFLKLTQLHFIMSLFPKEKRILNTNTILCVSDPKMTYQQRKEQARQQAIEWQHDFPNHDYSYGELYVWEGYFYKLGKRYGLLREFHENGIC